MTTAAITARTRAVPAAAKRPGLPGTLRSELTKIVSVRSTYWTLLAQVLASIGWAVLNCAGVASHGIGPDFNAAEASLTGQVALGELIIVVLGALVITSEYSTGMIRTSLTAMPRRTVVYAAKATVFTVVALAVTFVAAFISFFLGQVLLGSTHDTATLSQPNVLRAVVGSALYVTLCGLFAFTIGAILRHTAGAITAVIGLLFVIPILVHLLPQSWYQDIQRWLPDAAGRALSVTVGPSPDHLFSPWSQYAVFAIYTAVLLVIGAVLFRKRDA